jgi:hypothetical protein
MAKLNVVTGGDAAYPNGFAQLVCPLDKEQTTHVQRRVIAHWPGHWKGAWHILVQCGKCKLEYVWYTHHLPVGLQPYAIHIHAQGRVIPELNKEVPTLEESFTLLAPSRQAAYRQAQFSTTIPTAGQLVEIRIDGLIEQDELY